MKAGEKKTENGESWRKKNNIKKLYEEMESI